MNKLNEEVWQYTRGYPSEQSELPERVSHPATSWVGDGFRSLAKHDARWRRCPEFSVFVKEVKIGYEIFINPGHIWMDITHEEIRAINFSLSTILDRAWDRYEFSRTSRATLGPESAPSISLNAVRTGGSGKQKNKDEPAIDTVERNGMKVHDFKRVVPKPIVVTGLINGYQPGH